MHVCAQDTEVYSICVGLCMCFPSVSGVHVCMCAYANVMFCCSVHVCGCTSGCLIANGCHGNHTVSSSMSKEECVRCYLFSCTQYSFFCLQCRFTVYNFVTQEHTCTCTCTTILLLLSQDTIMGQLHLL